MVKGDQSKLVCMRHRHLPNTVGLPLPKKMLLSFEEHVAPLFKVVWVAATTQVVI